MAKKPDQADIEIIEHDFGRTWLLYGRTAKGVAVADSTTGSPGPDGAHRVVDPRVLLEVVGKLISVAHVSVAVFPRGS